MARAAIATAEGEGVESAVAPRVPVRRAKPGRRRPEPRGRPVIGTTSVAVVLVTWQVLSDVGVLDEELVPSPLRVLGAGWDLVMSGELLLHGSASLQNLAIGYFFAVVIGIPLGLLMGRVPVIHELLGPPISALYALPWLALIPLLITALGIGPVGQSSIVFLGAFIPMVVNAEAGAHGVDPILVRAASSFCASRRTTFFRVIMPASAGAILTGLTLGLGRGILAVVVGELFASSVGIGNLINRYGLNLDTPHLYFLVIFVGLLSYAGTRAMSAIAPRLGYREGQG